MQGMQSAIGGLFKSRKFLIAFSGLIMTVLGYYSGLPSEILISIDALFGAVILGIAAEDSAEKGAPKITENTTINAAPSSGNVGVVTQEAAQSDPPEKVTPA